MGQLAGDCEFLYQTVMKNYEINCSSPLVLQTKEKKKNVQERYFSLAYSYTVSYWKKSGKNISEFFFDFPSEMSRRKENVLKSNMAGYVLMCTLAVDNK